MKLSIERVNQINKELEALKPYLYRELDNDYITAICKEIEESPEYKESLQKMLHDHMNRVDSIKYAELNTEKKLIEQNLDMGCTHSGGVHDDDHTSGAGYWIFPASMTDEDIMTALTKYGYVEDRDRGVYDDNDWDCSGATMVDSPWIRKRTNTRVLVIQTWALDI
tara:strand:- start:646 stop:1143 length:498 start_codon:yes stop_codon:yes gene_type:complete